MSDPTSGWDFSRYSGTGSGATAPTGTPAPGAAAPDGAGAFGGSALTGGFGESSTVSGSAGGFGGAVDTASASVATSARSPLGWLIGGVVVAVLAGAAALLLGEEPVPAFVAWALAGPVAIGLFAVYLLLDTRRRTQLMYSPPTWAPWLYRGGLVVVLLAVIACAARIALWAGRVLQP
ncbi:hypothetical protein [Rathayibacter sp. VKM Ac-2760]|uniref:hypothetical protein n=1 Tax=Rathayibacter sp. VKM Ac-2760 TaxID=2609253 RepID=UPI001317CF54|nr:hypothetical protein [Rathayibacter sp. VKM Ac-2760]QHC57194.1 hypothetical protein GSU72_00330 [Rathayibacter sp. VKM Ac-2760]